MPTDWEAIPGLPDGEPARAQLRKNVDADLTQQFDNWKLDEINANLQKPHTGSDELELFDKFIVYQAQTIGVRLLLSEAVLRRVMQWVIGGQSASGSLGPIKGGVDYLEKFTGALVQNAKLRIGSARLDIQREHWRTGAPAIKRELAALQRQIKAANARCNQTPGWPQIEAAIKRDTNAYPRLNQNLTSLREFCSPLRSECFALGTIKPAGFFHEWAGWDTGRDPESVRQKVSGRK